MNLQIPTSIVASLAALLVLAGCEKSADTAPTASSTESAMNITGAGSSCIASMFDTCLEVCAQNLRNLSLSYDPLGSGEGIDRFRADAVDIGAADTPLRRDEVAKVGGPYLRIPVTPGMIAIALGD